MRQMNKKIPTKQSGFTLIEVMVVLAIIGIIISMTCLASNIFLILFRSR